MKQKKESADPTTVDEDEVARFAAMADEWWDPSGKFAPLHRFNPTRLGYIRRHLLDHFGGDGSRQQPFSGLRVLDIGCGGGLLAEPMARLGATVTGVDAGAANIRVAALHAKSGGLAIDYRHGTVEELAAAGASFDVVLNMEVIEHVADPGAFIDACGTVVGAGGVMIVATLNRTLRAFALAVVGAEYVLGWLPRGTHDWRKFLTPAELGRLLDHAGLAPRPADGLCFNPLSGRWSECRDVAVNYMIVADKPGATGELCQAS